MPLFSIDVIEGTGDDDIFDTTLETVAPWLFNIRVPSNKVDECMLEVALLLLDRAPLFSIELNEGTGNDNIFDTTLATVAPWLLDVRVPSNEVGECMLEVATSPLDRASLAAVELIVVV